MLQDLSLAYPLNIIILYNPVLQVKLPFLPPFLGQLHVFLLRSPWGFFLFLSSLFFCCNNMIHLVSLYATGSLSSVPLRSAFFFCHLCCGALRPLCWALTFLHCSAKGPSLVSLSPHCCHGDFSLVEILSYHFSCLEAFPVLHILEQDLWLLSQVKSWHFYISLLVLPLSFFMYILFYDNMWSCRSLCFSTLLKFSPALFTWQTLSLCFILFFRHDLLKLFLEYPKQSEAVHFLSVSVLLLVVAGVLFYYGYHFTRLTFIVTVCKGHTLFMFTSLALERMGCSKYLYIYNLAELKSTSTHSGPTHTSSFIPVEWSFPWRPSLVSPFTLLLVSTTLW